MTTLTPQSSRLLHPPEIWLVLQALGSVPVSAEAPPEITTDLRALAAARTHLLDQGLLLAGAQGRLEAAPEIEALVRPAAFPETVFMANIADTAGRGDTARLTCFSWTPAACVVNWVDAASDHHFERFAPQAAAECIWEHLASVCALDVDPPDLARPPLNPQEMQREIEQVRQTVLLTATQAVRSAHPISEALSWFVSGRRAWLMQNSDQGTAPAPHPAGIAELQQAVQALVARALKG